jgi:hypothetical protein
VRAVFSWSLTNLTDLASRVFQLLGIHPGPDITVSTAASLAGIPREQAYLALMELCDEHLLTKYGPGRYCLHELLRAYAAELAHSSGSAAERDAAVRRVLVVAAPRHAFDVDLTASLRYNLQRICDD